MARQKPIDHAAELRQVMEKMPGAFSPTFKGTITGADGRTTTIQKTAGGSVLSMSGDTPTPLIVQTLSTSEDPAEVSGAATTLLERVEANSAGTIYYPRIEVAIQAARQRYPKRKRLLAILEKLAAAIKK